MLLAQARCCKDWRSPILSMCWNIIRTPSDKGLCWPFVFMINTQLLIQRCFKYNVVAHPSNIRLKMMAVHVSS